MSFSQIFVSCGEGYVGQIKDDTTSSPTPTGSNEAGEGTDTKDSDITDKLRLDSLSLEPEFSASISILAKKSYVDPDANSQLNRTAMLPGMRRVVGQPDLHPGTGGGVSILFNLNCMGYMIGSTCLTGCFAFLSNIHQATNIPSEQHSLHKRISTRHSSETIS